MSVRGTPQRIIVICLVAIAALFSNACGQAITPAEKPTPDIQPTVEALAEVRVEEILASPLSARPPTRLTTLLTPQPTYTPLPTYAPVPSNYVPKISADGRTPTATPYSLSRLGLSRVNPVPVGKTGEFRDRDSTLRITLLRTVRGDEAQQLAQQYSRYRPEPLEEGFEYLVAEVEIEENDDVMAFSIYSGLFDAVSSNGVAYSWPYSRYTDDSKELSLEPYTGSGRRWGAWIVSKNDINPLLRYKPLPLEFYLPIYDLELWFETRPALSETPSPTSTPTSTPASTSE